MSDGSWREKDGTLTKTYSFATYLQGINFTIRIAEIAEFLNHHPDILITYRKVTIYSSTHEAGGIVTKKDQELATKFDEIYLQMCPPE